MEPLKPNVKKRILLSRSNVSAEEIEEYERLLAQRFATAPGGPVTTEMSLAIETREARIRELHRKLFGPT